MGMTDRVTRLRQESLDAEPSVSLERARLVTACVKNQPGTLSTPMARAQVFQHLMENKRIVILEGELIVGERGPAPKAAPTYPEVCCHTMEDLEILHTREKTPFRVDKAALREQSELIPFWQGRSLRDRLFEELDPAWKDAYECGVFTEFMEQRAPGHTVLDDKIYKEGFRSFQQRIDEAMEALDFLNDPKALARRDQLRAMHDCAGALIRLAERHAEQARTLAAQEQDPVRKAELLKMAEVCDRVPGEAPRDFWEALQYYWFVHVGVITELNTWDAFNPGRLDQHLLPFYRQGIEEGTLTESLARELLSCFWIKFNNQPAPPKVGVTAAESGTYTDFANINTGGVKPDGSDGVNEVTYLILDVIEEMRLLQPSSNVQLSRKNPDAFLKRAARIIRTGFGQPSIFNADAIVQELTRQGKDLVDARNGGASGCVEVGAFGKENYNLTGYLNLPKILEITLHNGVDPRTNKQVGLKTGDPIFFDTFQALFAAFEKQLNHFVDIKITGNNIIERLWAAHLPCPFLSLLIDDCIDKGKDYHDGGARYNTSYIQGVGLGTLTDALTAIHCQVFEEQTLSMAELMKALKQNFQGHEDLALRLRNRTPKYGNDDDRADRHLEIIFEALFKAVDGRPNTKGGTYHINLLPTTVHVYFGYLIGALPDGRLAGEPLSEGISPVQCMDRQGPTAVLKSAGKIDHLRTGGTLLNQKLTPHLLKGEKDLDKFVHLVRAYFKMDGHHIQFNVIDAETLRAAQKDPEKHRDLIVRVAGYSDYFCDLSVALQNEIILRTEHGGF